MARKQLQLQADLQNDEDFETFLTTPGLLVVEVYTEWCGPCLGILGTLRRMKLDKGDELNFAIAKSDTISYLHRFFKRSEPTWLFIIAGRVHSIMFGTDSPKLCKLINDLLRVVAKPEAHENFAINEPLPEEIKRDRIKNETRLALEQKATRELEIKKMDYFHFVTDAIMENLPDIGVTVFGPQIHRDLLRKIMEFGMQKVGIQIKDRRIQCITKEQFEMINTVCKNPLSPQVIEALDGKELSICFWKAPDGSSGRSVPEILGHFEEEVAKPLEEEEEILPPLVAPMKIKLEYELPDDEECPYDIDSDLEREKAKEQQKAQQEIPQDEIETVMGESEMGSEENAESIEEPVRQSVTMDFDDMNFDDDLGTEEFDYLEDLVPQKVICKKTVTLPGIWVPKDKRTHAALIYVLFRAQTLTFLPPDPVPEPPHVVMAFNTYKQKDLIEFAERYKDDIPAYGYFTSDEAEEAKFIANSKQNYVRHAQSASDKLVFKVNKRTSHTMLSLVTYGPTYVSFNTETGAKESQKFFPEDYVTAEQEKLQVDEEQKKKTKPKKGVGESIEISAKVQEVPKVEEAEPAAPEPAKEDVDGAEGSVGEGLETQQEQQEAASPEVAQPAEGDPAPEEGAAVPLPEEGAAVPPPEDAAAVPGPEDAAAVPVPEDAAAVPVPEEAAAVPVPEEATPAQTEMAA